VIKAPFQYDVELTAEEYQKLGELSLRWSHIEHVIGSCLKAMLRLSDDEATVMVFPLPLEHKLQRLNRLMKTKKHPEKAVAALAELTEIMKGIQYVRNNVIHAVVLRDNKEGHIFHLRSKERSIAKSDIFKSEELTNYAAHLTLTLRYALGIAELPGKEYASPDRPEIPTFLQGLIPIRKK
jgi:hypothetical protein